MYLPKWSHFESLTFKKYVKVMGCKVAVGWFLGEMQRIEFRLMLSSSVCVCVCVFVCVCVCVHERARACVCVFRVCGPQEDGLR